MIVGVRGLRRHSHQPQIEKAITSGATEFVFWYDEVSNGIRRDVTPNGGPTTSPYCRYDDANQLCWSRVTSSSEAVDKVFRVVELRYALMPDVCDR